MRAGHAKEAKEWFLKALEKDAADLRALKGYVRLSDLRDAHDVGQVDDLFEGAKKATSGCVRVRLHPLFLGCARHMHKLRSDVSVVDVVFPERTTISQVLATAPCS